MPTDMDAIISFSLGLAMLLSPASAAPTAPNQCCERLRPVLLPGQVIVPTNLQFPELQSNYWSALASSVTPGCFALPRDADDVSKIVKVLSQPQQAASSECRFAIKSGGFTPWAGAASIQGGIVIDLSRLNSVITAKDRTYVSIGPGSRWGDIYDKLQPQQIAISGGRFAELGVGGTLTGGGTSFFQGTEGPSCDGVLQHQVVLANGSIVETSRESFPDLHKALKGGNNNFGIVTRFDMKAFPHNHQIWAGVITHGSSKLEKNLAWFHKFANSSTLSSDSNGQILLQFIKVLGAWQSSGSVTYSKPVRYPAVFKEYSESALASTATLTSISSISKYNGDLFPSDTRTLWATFSYVNSASFMKVVLDLASQVTSSLPLASFLTVNFQPLWTKTRTNSFAASGGNAFGLQDSRDDLVIVLAIFTWSGSAQDGRIREMAKSFIDTASRRAQAHGVYSPYLFANYAADFQDVISSYGETSKNELIQVSKTYDPNQLFQKQVPGGFKLNRAASRSPPTQPSSQPKTSPYNVPKNAPLNPPKHSPTDQQYSNPRNEPFHEPYGSPRAPSSSPITSPYVPATPFTGPTTKAYNIRIAGNSPDQEDMAPQALEESSPPA